MLTEYLASEKLVFIENKKMLTEIYSILFKEEKDFSGGIVVHMKIFQSKQGIFYLQEFILALDIK